MRSGSGDMDGLNASLGPMLNYFNVLEDDKLMDAVTLFSRDIGFGSDYHICSFASNWHHQEEGFFESGVLFVDATGAEEKSVIVDYATFYRYLSMACEDYLSRHPQDRTSIEEALKTIRERYGIQP